MPDDLVQCFGKDAIQLLQGDPEPRIGSSRGAEVFQYGAHQPLARLIERHRPLLNELDRLVTVAKRPPGGGPEWTEYWLTEPQWIYVAAKSDTEPANRLTVQIVKAFQMYRRGLIVPNSPEILKALQPQLDEIKTSMQQLRDAQQRELPQIKFLTQEVHDGVKLCVEELKGSRKPLTQATLRAHGFVIDRKFNEECCVCRRLKVRKDGEWTAAARQHHHIDRNNNAFNATLVPCNECHDRYHHGDIEFQAAFHQAFSYYHKIAQTFGGPTSPGIVCEFRQAELPFLNLQ